MYGILMKSATENFVHRARSKKKSDSLEPLLHEMPMRLLHQNHLAGQRFTVRFELVKVNAGRNVFRVPGYAI